MSDFDPFSILPDIPDDPGSASTVCAAPPPPPAVSIVPAVPIKTTLITQGTNGNNLPANIGEELNKELAKRREGRMSTFTPERAAIIVEGVENGDTMEAIAASIGVKRQSIWTWMQLSPEFSDAVAQAREYQGHASADNAVDLLDKVDISGDDAKQNMAELRKAEQRARIRMQLAECFNFKQYGKKQQNMNLNVNATVSPVDLSKYS